MKRKYRQEEVEKRMIGRSFYFNPDDANIIVRRRGGIGSFTMNMGNPWSWMISGGILMIAFALKVLY